MRRYLSFKNANYSSLLRKSRRESFFSVILLSSSESDSLTSATCVSVSVSLEEPDYSPSSLGEVSESVSVFSAPAYSALDSPQISMPFGSFLHFRLRVLDPESPSSYSSGFFSPATLTMFSSGTCLPLFDSLLPHL